MSAACEALYEIGVDNRDDAARVQPGQRLQSAVVAAAEMVEVGIETEVRIGAAELVAE